MDELVSSVLDDVTFMDEIQEHVVDRPAFLRALAAAAIALAETDEARLARAN
jgi:hypothetical protein